MCGCLWGSNDAEGLNIQLVVKFGWLVGWCVCVCVCVRGSADGIGEGTCTMQGRTQSARYTSFQIVADKSSCQDKVLVNG